MSMGVNAATVVGTYTGMSWMTVDSVPVVGFARAMPPYAESAVSCSAGVTVLPVPAVVVRMSWSRRTPAEVWMPGWRMRTWRMRTALAAGASMTMLWPVAVFAWLFTVTVYVAAPDCPPLTAVGAVL